MIRKSNTRRFTMDKPVLFNGQYYPSTNMPVDDGNGNIQDMTVFADRVGNYFTPNGEDVILQGSLPEVVIHPKEPTQSEILANMFNNYLTMSNDRTKVNYVPHREYNTHLNNRAIQGARSNALWEKEHPNAASWMYTLNAAPFVVAAAPVAITAGQTLAASSAGQVIRNGIGRLLTMPHVKVSVDATNYGLGAYFGGKGVEDISQGIFTPNTALDILGLYGAYKSGSNFINTFKKNNYLNKELQGREPLSFDIKKEGAKRYSDFIKSDEYEDRLKNAGLQDYRDYMINLTNKRIGNIDYFPASTATVMKKYPEASGLSYSSPINEIVIKKGLPTYEFSETLDHEIAHYATKNAGIDDKTPIGNIMRYNESIVPNIDWEDKLSLYPKNTPISKIEDDYDFYNYLIEPQEKRARAYSILQQAKNNGVSPNAFVDMFIKNGKIAWYAPEQLQQMNKVLTTENIKKYLNKFLSVGTPLGLPTFYLNSKNSQHDQK